jgi:hypothetical protein
MISCTYTFCSEVQIAPSLVHDSRSQQYSSIVVWTGRAAQRTGAMKRSGSHGRQAPIFVASVTRGAGWAAEVDADPHERALRRC